MVGIKLELWHKLVADTGDFPASSLPELPPSLFGWIPALWRISDAEILATAGLDAYVVSAAPPIRHSARPSLMRDSFSHFLEWP